MLAFVIVPLLLSATLLGSSVTRRLLLGRWDFESLVGAILGPPLLVVAYIYLTEGQPLWVRIGAPIAVLVGGFSGFANAKWREEKLYQLVRGLLILLVLGIGGYVLLTSRN